MALGPTTASLHSAEERQGGQRTDGPGQELTQRRLEL